MYLRYGRLCFNSPFQAADFIASNGDGCRRGILLSGLPILLLRNINKGQESFRENLALSFYLRLLIAPSPTCRFPGGHCVFHNRYIQRLSRNVVGNEWHDWLKRFNSRLLSEKTAREWWVH
jgi:hypothetical protein